MVMEMKKHRSEIIAPDAESAEKIKNIIEADGLEYTSRINMDIGSTTFTTDVDAILLIKCMQNGASAVYKV